MSGLDYSKFSLSSALMPSQPASATSYPSDPSQQHVAEDVTNAHMFGEQRDDHPSSPQSFDRPRERAFTLSGPYQGQGPSSRAITFPRPSLPSDPADDVQGNNLCARLRGIHFTRHGGSVDEPVIVPTAISENPYVHQSVQHDPLVYVPGGSSWASRHSPHYPTPVRGSMSQSIQGAGVSIPEDARPGLTALHCDVSARVPARRASMAVADRQPGRSYDFSLPSPFPSMCIDVGPFLSGGMITSPSPPPTAYHDDDFQGAECSHAFTYAERLPAMTRSTAHEPATHYPLDRSTVQSLGGFQEASRQEIISFDHNLATTMGTPFPVYSSSQSPHDHSPSFNTAMYAEGLPRPGSAPPLIDNQVPFVGDARAVLRSSPEHAATADFNQLQAWYFQAAAPSVGQSPRSSPRRAGSIGHNSTQKTPPGSRHLRRWSSVTNPALRASPPFSPSFSPNVIPFPRYPAPPSHQPPSSSDNAFSHFSPRSESESDDLSPYTMSHAAATVELTEAIPADHSPQQQPQQPQLQPQPQQPSTRPPIRCDGCLIDEDSWTNALSRQDKLIHVYECFWDLANSPCGMWIEGDQSNVADHLALRHGFRGGEVTTRCLWRECPKPHMKGTSIARHVVTHIGFRIKCPSCTREFARVDACNRAHSRSGCLGVGQPMYGDLERVLDARRADPSLRPSKKRKTDE